MVFILRNRGYSVENKSSSSATIAPANAPPNLTPKGVSDISAALNMLLADVFTLYLKTKNFHWHMSGPHFRDYHLLLDEQAAQLFTITDPIAERVRKVGGTTLHSIGHINRLQRILDNDAYFVTAADMLAELGDDNEELITQMREAHGLCDEQGDVATMSLLENWIDEAEGRAWFLLETGSGECHQPISQQHLGVLAWPFSVFFAAA